MHKNRAKIKVSMKGRVAHTERHNFKSKSLGRERTACWHMCTLACCGAALVVCERLRGVTSSNSNTSTNGHSGTRKEQNHITHQPNVRTCSQREIPDSLVAWVLSGVVVCSAWRQQVDQCEFVHLSPVITAYSWFALIGRQEKV